MTSGLHADCGELSSLRLHGDVLIAATVRERTRSDIGAILLAVRVFMLVRKKRAVIASERGQRRRGIAALAILLAITKQRKLILLDFRPPRRSGLMAAVATITYRIALRRACLVVQVKSVVDGQVVANRFRVPEGLIHSVPPYWSCDGSPGAAASDERFGILASGVSYDDASLLSLLEAAKGQQWPLTILASGKNYRKYSAQAKSIGVSIIEDVSQQAFDTLLAASRLFVDLNDLPGTTVECDRMMAAVAAGTPAIGIGKQGCRDYFELTGHREELVHSEKLRQLITRYLDVTPDEFERIVGAVRKKAAERTRSDHERDLSEVLVEYLRNEP